MKRAIHSKEQRLVTDTTPVKVSAGAQSRDRFFARLESTCRGANSCLSGGTCGVGRTARAEREGMKECYCSKFGREQLLNIAPTRAACGTILRISNVPRQRELLDITHQGEICIESMGFQGGRSLCADITTASLSRYKAAGERAYLLSSHTSVNGAARAEGPPGTCHVIMSDTQ